MKFALCDDGIPHFVRNDKGPRGFGVREKGRRSRHFSLTPHLEKAPVIPMRPPAGGQGARDLRIGRHFITLSWFPDSLRILFLLHNPKPSLNVKGLWFFLENTLGLFSLG